MGSTALLDGLTVLDLSSVGPASRASRILADYGASVVKVGPVARKGGVQIRPPFHTYGAGRGMRRLRIDLKAREGRETFLRMAAGADIVIESFRPGVVTRLGIGYDTVRTVNAGIVYCSTSGYGQTGERARWAGHDINYLAVSGFLACCEPRADGGPPIPGATVADSAGGGMHAVIAILAALVKRATSGQGCYLDVSAAEGVLSLMSLSLDQFSATGEVAGPRQTLLTGRFACYDLYRTRDGKWLSVGAIEPRFFRNLCTALDLEHFAGSQFEDSRQDEIRAEFQRLFAGRDRDEWVAMLVLKDTCVAPVQSLDEVTADPYFRARGVFMEARHPQRGAYAQVGPILAGGDRDQAAYAVRGSDDTDTDDILCEVGLGVDEIGTLRAAGVVE